MSAERPLSDKIRFRAVEINGSAIKQIISCFPQLDFLLTETNRETSNDHKESQSLSYLKPLHPFLADLSFFKFFFMVLVSYGCSTGLLTDLRSAESVHVSKSKLKTQVN